LTLLGVRDEKATRDSRIKLTSLRGLLSEQRIGGSSGRPSIYNNRHDGALQHCGSGESQRGSLPLSLMKSFGGEVYGDHSEVLSIDVIVI